MAAQGGGGRLSRSLIELTFAAWKLLRRQTAESPSKIVTRGRLHFQGRKSYSPRPYLICFWSLKNHSAWKLPLFKSICTITTVDGQTEKRRKIPWHLSFRWRVHDVPLGVYCPVDEMSEMASPKLSPLQTTLKLYIIPCWLCRCCVPFTSLATQTPESVMKLSNKERIVSKKVIKSKNIMQKQPI